MVSVHRVCTRKSECPFSIAVVSQIRFSQITGEDQPSRSTAVFQSMPASSLHLIGSPTWSDRPCPFGPRNCDHSSPHAVAANRRTNAVAVKVGKRVRKSRGFAGHWSTRINARYPCQLVAVSFWRGFVWVLSNLTDSAATCPRRKGWTVRRSTRRLTRATLPH